MTNIANHDIDAILFGHDMGFELGRLGGIAEYAFFSWKTAKYSRKQRTISLFFRPLKHQKPRISAENELSIAVNFGKNSEKQRELAARVPISRGGGRTRYETVARTGKHLIIALRNVRAR